MLYVGVFGFVSTNYVNMNGAFAAAGCFGGFSKGSLCAFSPSLSPHRLDSTRFFHALSVRGVLERASSINNDALTTVRFNIYYVCMSRIHLWRRERRRDEHMPNRVRTRIVKRVDEMVYERAVYLY